MFSDVFATLNLSNYVTGATGTWQLGGRSYSPSGNIDGNTFEPNPFNPQTPFYMATTDGTTLTMKLDNTPTQYAAACGNQPYVSAWLSTRLSYSQTYGYFEASIAVNLQQGLTTAFWLQPQSGIWPPEIDIVEFDYPSGGLVAVNNVYQLDGTGLGNWWDYTVDGNFHLWGCDWQADTTTSLLGIACKPTSIRRLLAPASRCT